MKKTGSFLLGTVVGVVATIAYNSKTVQSWKKKVQEKYYELKDKVQEKVREQEIEENLESIAEEIDEKLKTNN